MTLQVTVRFYAADRSDVGQALIRCPEPATHIAVEYGDGPGPALGDGEADPDAWYTAAEVRAAFAGRDALAEHVQADHAALSRVWHLVSEWAAEADDLAVHYFADAGTLKSCIAELRKAVTGDD